ncbi:MAG: trimeric intracellular cation channel family protein [Clostridia bacterium]|nr:trimeric intracellular cation channel family protein [Clostridia bacterium]
MNEIVLNWIIMLGTVAFSVSGALIAVRCGLDLFGVVFIGCMTSVGGGIIRDLLCGHFPPLIFSDLRILTIAAGTSVAVFIISWFNRKKFDPLEKQIETINNIVDAAGLAAVSVYGVETTISAGYGHMALFTVLMGMTTGVGGSIIRDILVDRTPSILKKRIYALASLFGSIVYYIVRQQTDQKLLATYLAIPTIFLIRLLATRFRWKMPHIKIE